MWLSLYKIYNSDMFKSILTSADDILKEKFSLMEKDYYLSLSKVTWYYVFVCVCVCVCFLPKIVTVKSRVFFVVVFFMFVLFCFFRLKI